MCVLYYVRDRMFKTVVISVVRDFRCFETTSVAFTPDYRDCAV